MAICKSCGEEYNEAEVISDCWIVAGGYDSSVMAGLCRDCAIEAWDEKNETDSWDEFEDLDEDQAAARGVEAFFERLSIDKIFRSRFK